RLPPSRRRCPDQVSISQHQARPHPFPKSHHQAHPPQARQVHARRFQNRQLRRLAMIRVEPRFTAHDPLYPCHPEALFLAEGPFVLLLSASPRLRGEILISLASFASLAVKDFLSPITNALIRVYPCSSVAKWFCFFFDPRPL